MTTYVLMVFLAYAGCAEPGCGVALTNATQNFFAEKDCQSAAVDQIEAFKAAGFRRFAVTCFRRTGPLLEPETEERR